MICSFLAVIMLTFAGASGQSCKQTSGSTGYCREKDDCFGPSQESSCQKGFTCCQSTGLSENKCKEYGKYVFRKDFNEALTARIFVHNVSECSIEAVPLIVGGIKAKPKEFPHMVSIGYGKNLQDAAWMCGGTLISENYVLTAAHCSQSAERGSAKFARMGSSSLESFDAPNSQYFTVAKWTNHPKYKPPSRYYDIALFKLSHPATIGGFVRPACLHTTPDELRFERAMATGWGKLNYHDSEGSKYLMKVALSLVNNTRCNASYSVDIEGRSLPRGLITSQMCAGEQEGGKDTCQGDSGGPLQIVRKEPYCMYSVMGVTSFGKYCGFKNSPAVYTRVSYFVPWIESIVWQ